ncbi:unnamed protein product, partial [marine sediment metagenome]
EEGKKVNITITDTTQIQEIREKEEKASRADDFDKAYNEFLFETKKYLYLKLLEFICG